MARRDILTAAVWAVGTFALALAVVLPVGLTAADSPAARPTIARPTLSVNGIRLSVDVVGPASQFPMKLKVTADNPGKSAAAASFTVTVYEQSIASMISRVPSTPTQEWTSGQQNITVAAGQSTQKTFTTPAIDAPKGMISVAIGSGHQQIAAYWGSIAPPTTRPTIVGTIRK
ncbi:MAG TPA: hypothetical protein VL992_05495 [Tepidisphaeraceae bacterium]|nr:hypothetical protein [Tepidisphaeraceae bacterium]